MKIVHTYIGDMYIDQKDENKNNFAQKWGLVSLAKQGHNIILLCGSKDNVKREFIWNNIQVIQLPHLIKITNSTKILKGFLKEINKLKPDIIHSHHYSLFIPELSLLYAKKKNIPIILSIHSTFTEGSFVKKVLGISYLLFMQPFLPLYNHTTFISKYLKDKKRFLLVRNKSSIVYNQVLLPKKSRNRELKNEKTNLLFIGRISHQKGIDVLIKATKIVAKTIPDINLNIIGSGNKKYTEKLKKICNKEKISDKVNFLGYKRGEDKQKILNISDVMVIPSRDEGFGNVVIEGMYQKIPCIISDAGALKEASGNNLTLFKSKNHKDLAEKIITKINNLDNENNRINIEKAYKHAKTFSTEKIGQELNLIYNKYNYQNGR